MTIRKTKTALLVLLAVSSKEVMSQKWRVSYNDDVDTCSKVALAVGGGVLAACGIYKLLDWATGKSNEELLHDGHHAHNRMRNDYGPLIEYLETHLRIPHTSREQERVIHSVNEPILYHIACAHNGKVSINDFLVTLRSEIRDSHAIKNELNKRIHKLQNGALHDAGARHMLHEMQSVYDSIVKVLYKVEFAGEYVGEHKGYFALFEKECQLMHRHKNALSVCEQSLPVSRVREALRAAVIAGASRRPAYPYLVYVEQLQVDMDQLHESMHRCSYNYQNRLSAARDLRSKLEKICSVVISDDEYLREIRAREQEKLERERLEAENRKARALEDQARSAREQVKEMNRTNAIRERELCEERIRNELRYRERAYGADAAVYVRI